MSAYLPDFGSYLRAHAAPGTTFSFGCMPIETFARVGEHLFSVTLTMPHGGEAFAMTIDLPRQQCNDLIALMPREIATPLTALFGRPFQRPQVVNLPAPVEVAIDAVLGEEQKNGEDCFVPLTAQRIQAAERSESP